MSGPVLVAALLVAVVAARRSTAIRAAGTRLQPPPAARVPPQVRAASTQLVQLARRRAVARRLDRDLPLALDEVARSLRGGCSLPQALTAGGAVPGPAGAAVAGLAADVAAGRPAAAAAGDWAAGSSSGAVALAAVAVALAADAGGTSARAVDGVAASLRERAEAADEAYALGAQARLSALVIGVAPLGFAALAAATDPRTAAFLLGSPVGLLCLAAGIALDGAALVWMRRITGAVG